MSRIDGCAPGQQAETREQIAKAARHHVRLAVAALRRHPADERVQRIIEVLDRLDENVLSPLSKGREPKP